MEMTTFSIMPVLVVLTSAAASILIMLLRDQPDRREAVSLIAGIIKFFMVITMVPAVREGQVIVCDLFHILPGLNVVFRVDGFSLVFACVSSFLWIFTTLYSIGYMRGLNEHA